MKKILHITRTELYNFYYSPIAWSMLVLFMVLTCADYFSVVQKFLTFYEQGGPYLEFTKYLTDIIIDDGRHPGYFVKIISNLYIFFPLLTMGLISREISNGTMKLLYSSPVRISEIVLGKFLAMVAFTFSLIVVILFTYVALSMSLSHPDYGHMIAALVGLFLVLCAYAAIGLFISSLTSYPLVAAIITFAVFALFSRIGGLWQDIDWLRNITYYLNLSGKSDQLINGFTNSRDIVYFLIVIATFLIFTVIKIKSGTESISVGKKILRYTTVVLMASVLGYITSRPALNIYHDATEDQLYTIAPPTQKMVSKLNDGPLEITAYVNALQFRLASFVPAQQNNLIAKLFEPYIRFKSDIKIKFVYYYNADSTNYWFKLNPGKSIKEIAAIQAGAVSMSIDQFLPPAEVHKLFNVDKEENRHFFVLKYKGKETVVRTFEDILFWPSENEMAAAINRLISTPPKIAFLTDELERGPFSLQTRDYNALANKLDLRSSLINQGFDFEAISLKNIPAIPLSYAALTIADPRTPFTAENLQKINAYIAAGGNLYLGSEPDRKHIIKPIFDGLGLSLREGMLVQSSDKYSSDFIFSRLTDRAKNFSPRSKRFTEEQITYYGDTTLRIAMSGASALNYEEKDGFKISPLFTTDPKLCWNRVAPISSDSLSLKVKELPSDEHGRFVTSLLMERKVNEREQRIIVASDADYLTGAMFGDEPERYNKFYPAWCFGYFSYGKFPANTLHPETDNSFKIKVTDLGIQKIFLFYLIPGIIIVIASIILIRRKRK
ncbi:MULTISPECIES: Gldg family protein [Pedobacter]|jgi:ABC-2 type transport system permease protein|uniref:Gldg family protein n=1 Tax=Pedobacter TaxID=84567 RepID=UPI0029313933|nr:MULTISPECIES: Gldg family protein [Pedobacter]HWW39689.1 Gldg family protein [Pedobacter sp.]